MTTWTGGTGEGLPQGIVPAGPQGIVPMVIETGARVSGHSTSTLSPAQGADYLSWHANQ